MSQKQKKDKTLAQKAWQQFIEIGILAIIAGLLYWSGYHTEVIGTLQRGLLATGLLRPNTSVNQTEPTLAAYNYELYTLDGQRTSLQEFKGKTVFLNFWATWCPPCIAEMPSINKLFNDLGEDEDIVFVMLSLDETPEIARSFMERKGYNLPVYFPASRRPGVYNSTAIPTTYVISPEGKIVLEKRGMANYNTSSFKEFLREL